mmetsp:Transcript_38386/g.86322  ORF Transcript_38386/g.86322 Transcript_38386/m.86322 type:complete len:486 (+) Transcript_38386:2-1459(+)
MSFMVLMIVVSLSVMSDFEEVGAVKWAAMVAFIMCIILPLGIFCYKYRDMVINERYEAFICHHKADGSAQARLLKMFLVAKTGRKVFIDSDDLVELDSLFNIVKSKVKLLLVYLTRDTLTRPWCVGEITTAFNSHGRVRVLTVRTPSFQQPSEEEASRMYDLVDHGSCNLQEQGLDRDLITEALLRVVGKTTQTIHLNAAQRGSQKFLDVANRVLSKGTETSSRPAPPSASERPAKTKAAPRAGQVVASADTSDDEAVAAITILMKKIAPALCALVDKGVVNLVDMDDGSELSDEIAHVEMSSACVFVLSRRSLEVVDQVVMIVAGMSISTVSMVPVNLWDFKFPTNAFYEDFARLWPTDLQINADIAQERVKAFFKLITVFFATMSSDSVLDTQAEQVVSRIDSTRSKKKGELHSAPQDLSSVSILTRERSDGKLKESCSMLAGKGQPETQETDVRGNSRINRRITEGNESIHSDDSIAWDVDC